MQPQSQVRVLNALDLEAYKKLRFRALAETPEAFGTALSEVRAFSEAAWLHEITPTDHPFSCVLGLFLDEQLIATAALTQGSLSATAHIAALTRVYVAPEFRGKKYSRLLINATIAKARTHPALQKLTLSVATSATAARALYDALGFSPFGNEAAAFLIAGKPVTLEHRHLFLRKMS